MALTLPRTVVALGLVSFFNDVASEIVVPLIPILLAGVLGAGPIARGLIEGVADAVASFLEFAAPRERGTAFGWYNLVVGLAAIPAGLLFGGIWQMHGAHWAFATAAVLATSAASLLAAWAWPRRLPAS